MPPKPIIPALPDDLVARTFAPTAPPPAGKSAFSLPYRLYVPRDYVQTRRYPLLVVLHGAGERGTDNEKHLVNGVLSFCDADLQKRYPTFVLYPQCPPDAQWVEASWSTPQYDQAQVPLSRPLGAVAELMTTLASEFTIEPKATLAAGLSMGGFGTFDLVTRFPERFTGALAICGGGDPARAAAARAVPLWAFHGARDEVVPVAGSRGMVAAWKKAGGQVKYTEYPDAGHHVWARVLADRAILTWLLSRRRKAA